MLTLFLSVTYKLFLKAKLIDLYADSEISWLSLILEELKSLDEGLVMKVVRGEWKIDHASTYTEVHYTEVAMRALAGVHGGQVVQKEEKLIFWI